MAAELCGRAWTGGAVKWGQSLEVLLKIFFEKLPYSPSFLYFLSKYKNEGEFVWQVNCHCTEEGLDVH